MPSKGSKWVDRETHRCVVVLADAEGWIMARVKDGKPFVVHNRDWHDQFKRVPKEKSK